MKYLLEVVYLYVYLSSYLDITVESQDDRFLSMQDAKQAVEQFNSECIQDLVYTKKTKDSEKKVKSLLP